jgi:hypothetical protein
MSGKKSHNFKSPFDDSNLPLNDLSVERTEEIEKLVLPRLNEAFKKLHQEKPHLFKASKKQ